MKSFNQHLNEKREELKEDPLDDLTDLLWVGAAGAGLWGLGKAWDKWGKDAAAELPFATKGMKAAKIDRAKEKKDKKISDAQKIADDPDSSAKDKKDAEKVLDKEMSAVDKAERETGKKEKEKGDTEKIEKGKVATGEYSTDKAGIIDNQGDAQKYREATGSAPEGWATSDGKTPEGAAPKPAKGIVWTSDDEEKWKDKEDDRKEDEKDKKDSETGDTKTASNTKTEPVDTSKTTGTTTAPRKTIGTSREPRGKMTITESNELQAIMALDDAGIKAEINRKGQVVIKKKDKKRAHRALEKSFTKGGWPSLKLEDVEIEEASNKKAMKKVADELEAIADKGGAEAPALFSMASRLRNGQLPTGLKVSKKVSAVFKKHGIREEVQKPRTAYEVVSEARDRIIETIDRVAADELYNFMQNERDLERQKDSIIKNIVRKKKSGKYDHSKAPKLWMYWVDNGAKAYDKEYSSPGVKTFDKDTRQSVAIQFSNEYNAEIDLGNYS